jgi:hypothetical protein
MIGILERVFGCSHRNTTFPITRTRKAAAATGAPKVAYVVCLECGTEFDYDWQAMKIGKPVPARLFAISSLTPENTAAR